MEKRDRKRDILELALKTSSVRAQKKCRRSLLSEFDKKSAIVPVTSSSKHVASVMCTTTSPDNASAVFSNSSHKASAAFTATLPNAVYDNVTEVLHDASTVLTNSSHDASAARTAILPNAVYDNVTESLHDASAVPSKSSLQDVSSILTNSSHDAFATFTTTSPNAASAIITNFLPHDVAILSNTSLNLSFATLTNVTSPLAETSAAHSESILELNNNSSTIEFPENISNNIPNSEEIVLPLMLEVLPGTSSGTDTNNIRTSTFRATHLANKISYLDYMSDDEIVLLNAFGEAESSDEWEPEANGKKRKKIHLEIEEDNVGNNMVKKIPKNKRKEAAKKRLSGHSYIKTNGEVAQEKKVQPNPCVGKKCGNSCGDITEERRLSIFKYFWQLSEQRRKEWIATLTQKVNIKRKRSKNSEKRNLTYKYHITDGESHRQVCLQFLSKTIDVSHKYIYYTVSNIDEYGSTKESQKGKSIPPNKTNSDDIIAIEQFIKSLPAVPSHYCRKDSTRTYLPAEYKNLANLYRKYKEHRSSQGLSLVSESIFRKVFNENFNIAFHIPKKDKCLKCCQFENKSEPTSEERRVHEEHLIEKEHTYNRYKMHKTIHVKDPASLCLSFDLQKVLNTPYGDNMLLFYSRKLSVYNAVIYENGTRNVCCYYWNESQGNRGANEMATIISKHIMKIDERGNIKRLLLYCDCCPGQNRNKIVLAMLNETLQRCKTIESIQMNFLLTGHTYMTVDSAHATIENQVKNTTIWAPSQWYTVFQTARQNPRPFDVEPLTHTDFKRWDILADKYFVGNLVGKISKIRVITLKKNRTTATVKYSMNPEAPVSRIEIASKTKLTDLPNCYLTPLPINEKKHKDLLKLCSDQIIPQQFQAEYLVLTCGKKVREALPDTDIEDTDQ